MPEAKARLAAFLQGLHELGWTDGHNARIDTRWSAANADNLRKYAAELVALAPDVIMANGSSPVGLLQQATRTVPIVFVNVTDPVGAGFVNYSLRFPGCVGDPARIEAASVEGPHGCARGFEGGAHLCPRSGGGVSRFRRGGRSRHDALKAKHTGVMEDIWAVRF